MLLMLADKMQSAPFYTEILEARDLLEEVIDLAPESLAARYMAAALAERTGDYEIAVRELNRLARRLPDDREVALRLAVNRLRTGDTRAGRTGLQTVARGGGPDWVRVLAYQEWVRLVASSRGGAELELLEEARSAFPHDPQLSLQAAAALLRSGEWSSAERVAAAGTGDPWETSPRSLYDLPRRDEIDAERVEFDAEVRAGLPRLRALLSTTSDASSRH